MGENKKGIKDHECASCKKIFECAGKPERNMSCVNYEERNKGSEKYESKGIS